MGIICTRVVRHQQECQAFLACWQYSIGRENLNGLVAGAKLPGQRRF